MEEEGTGIDWELALSTEGVVVVVLLTYTWAAGLRLRLWFEGVNGWSSEMLWSLIEVVVDLSTGRDVTTMSTLSCLAVGGLHLELSEVFWEPLLAYSNERFLGFP